MTTIDQALRRAKDLLYTKGRFEADLNDVREQLKSPRLVHISSARLSDYEYRNLVSERERLEQEEHQAWMRFNSARSELDKVAQFLREQTTAFPQQAAEIARVLNQHDKSGDQYLARVREQAVQASIANARAEWNRAGSPAARQKLIAVLTQHQRWNDLLPLALEDVRNAPNDRRARQQLASVYERLGKRDDLLTLLKQDLASAPGDADLRRRIAGLLVQMGRYDDAIDHLRRDMAAPKPEPWATDLMLQALERAKKTDALILLLRNQVKSDPRNTKWRQKLGDVLEQERRWDEYIAFLKDQVRFYPAETQWRRKLDSVLEQNQRWNDLISLYEQDISRNPGDPQLRERVAGFYRRSGRFDDVLNLHLLPAARRSPSDFQPKQAVLETLLDAQRDDDVLSYIREELGGSEAGASLLSQFVAVLAKRRRSDLVGPLAESYLPPTLERADAYMAIARGFRQNDELKAALAFLDGMSQQAPDDKVLKELPIAFLVESLESPSSATRAFVLQQLYARLDRERAVKPLKELFAKTDNVYVQCDVVKALSEIQQGKAIPFLHASLNHTVRSVRSESAKSLGELGQKRGKRLLRQRYRLEEESSVRTAIENALRQIDPKAKITPPLKARSVLRALVLGGLLGTALGVSQILAISYASSSVEIIMASAVVGAVVLGIPAGFWQANTNINIGCTAAIFMGVLMGGIAAGLVSIIQLALSKLGLLPVAFLNYSITIIVTAAIVAIFSLAAVIAFDTDRLWMLPATALLLVTAVVIPASDWTGFLANLNLSGQTRQVAPLDQASSNAQEEALGIPIDAAVAAGTPTLPPPALPAGIPADAQSAKVISVLGGNSLQVQLIDRVATVSYAEVTAPAASEPGAGAAAQIGESLLLDQWVWLERPGPAQSGTDIAAYVWLEDGTLANLRLVTLGYALPDLSRPGDGLASQLKRAATEAWEGRAGFWAGGTDVTPWAAVIVDVANIRQGPGTDRAVVAQAVRGDIFVITGRNANGDWLQIQVGNAAAAWIFAELVQTTTAISTLPVVLP